MTPAQVAAVLARHEARTVPHGQARRAAVLVPLRVTDGELEIILIVRTLDGGVHGGQVAFPGGKLEAGDTSVEAAALREADEEIGIPPGAVQVMGRLDEMYTVTNFHVVPVVGLVRSDVELRPNPSEVARVFSVPLRDLLDAQRWVTQRHEYRGNSYDVWHFPFGGEDIWGATGKMLRDFVEMLWES